MYLFVRNEDCKIGTVRPTWMDDVLSMFGYGNEIETAMNIEMKDGYVLILDDCSATLSASDENVFFG